MRVALVYDRINKWGGAERVLLALKELFPDAPLYTSVYNPKKAIWARDFKVRPSFLNRFPFASSSHELLPFAMPIAFEQFSFDEYDVVISVTSEAGKGIITKPKTLHICYCLTPTRYLWSGYEEYFAGEMFRLLTKPLVSYLRTWDRVAASRPDAILAISNEVQDRIKKYYRRESEVIYPPAGIFNFQFSIFNEFSKFKTKKTRIKERGYFLVVSRLVPYKRIDIAIKTCRRLGVPLKIVGIGSDSERLKRMADTNVEFLGSLTDDLLVEYYKSCLALIYPGCEDFGISMVEAQAMGKPVIAFGAGGAKEIIIEGKTGEFFPTQSQDSLRLRLETFRPEKYKKDACIANAARFSKKKFQEDIMKYITNAFQAHKR